VLVRGGRRRGRQRRAPVGVLHAGDGVGRLGQRLLGAVLVRVQPPHEAFGNALAHRRARRVGTRRGRPADAEHGVERGGRHRQRGVVGGGGRGAEGLGHGLEGREDV